jgi:cysteine desulfurase/selenocysteine lyase
MNDEYYRDFGPFGDRIWINCAHQGPLPRVAVEEAYQAINWKITPYELVSERFSSVPARLKRSLARLVGASPSEIVLGNSASYGLHLLANGIPWHKGDEVLLVYSDFPSDILPWLALEKQDVIIRYIKPKDYLPEPEELETNITPSTRLFCTTWVHSFSGKTADIEALGKICKAHNIIFAVNASQAIGARPLDVSGLPVDAVISVGFKWLCGPYGTGFCWIEPKLVKSLVYNQAYWLTMQTADDLGRKESEVRLPEGLPNAGTYDVFGTANFFNFKPWTASIEYLLQHGIERIAEYDQQLVSQLIDGLDSRKYRLMSPREETVRSTLVFISHKDSQRNTEIYQTLKEKGVEVAFRRGKLRLSPHLYNTKEDIERALAVLNAVK